MAVENMSFNSSETTTAVDVRYGVPGRMREYRIVRTNAEFCTTRITSVTYLIGKPKIVRFGASPVVLWLDIDVSFALDSDNLWTEQQNQILSRSIGKKSPAAFDRANHGTRRSKADYRVCSGVAEARRN